MKVRGTLFVCLSIFFSAIAFSSPSSAGSATGIASVRERRRLRLAEDGQRRAAIGWYQANIGAVIGALIVLITWEFLAPRHR
jgi:hypothetical protein